jgi:hypothetical protein
MFNQASLPRCLQSEEPFEHKAEVLCALQAGASIRREERLVVAESHSAVYGVRIGLAKDSRLIKGHERQAASAVEDMSLFLARLQRNLSALTRAWHTSAPSGERFTIVENEATSELLGCLSGRVERKELGSGALEA